ncbi:PP2C family protein-serine/threonine phosphatase [Arenimonas maotaiensis]|jgi:serine/threonine protein phosphatase PrpC|nr:SpoIIE family protein phosphatase [Arenimonas maotaiensis]
MIEIGHISHPGRKRPLNEDSYDIDAPNGQAVLVDGMGGPDAGDIASAFVRDQVRRGLLAGESPADALMNAGQALRIQRPAQSGNPCGASAVCVRWHGNGAELAQVGTCRVLFWDGNALKAVSGSEADDAGQPAKSVPSIQALGITAGDKLRIAAAELPWRRGQALVLCTDAMLEQCRPADLREILCDARASAQEAAERMLLLALRGDADENLSALILRRA